jgi:hypothetical protein
MKNKNKYFELVKQASANVSMYIKQWSTRNNDRWGEHEATWKALLFHELILIDEKVKDSLSMENTPHTKNKRTRGKRIDMWLGDSNNIFVIEVKLIHYKKRDSGYGISNLNSKAGVYGDLLKLQGYLTSKDGSGVNGIVIAVHEVDNRKDKEDRNLDVKKIIAKIDPKPVDLLSDNLQLLVCSNGECAYANADTS